MVFGTRDLLGPLRDTFAPISNHSCTIWTLGIEFPGSKTAGETVRDLMMRAKRLGLGVAGAMVFAGLLLAQQTLDPGVQRSDLLQSAQRLLNADRKRLCPLRSRLSLRVLATSSGSSLRKTAPEPTPNMDTRVFHLQGCLTPAPTLTRSHADCLSRNDRYTPTPAGRACWRRGTSLATVLFGCTVTP